MNATHRPAGYHMTREIDQALAVFVSAASADYRAAIQGLSLNEKRAIYTVARGSSDAAANILSYEFMHQLGVPVTSLPPSVFSLGHGVALQETAMLVISQSGASNDLVRTAKGGKERGATVLAITNLPGSAVEAEADVTLPIGAGTESAVPATKTVIGSIAAGMALLSAISPAYGEQVSETVESVLAIQKNPHPDAEAVQAAFLRARHVYVIGRETGYGAAHEIALKIKECCAIHAEAYSSSEVLHGPLQLATNPLMVLILDTGQAHIQNSLDETQARFEAVGCDVHRMRATDTGAGKLRAAGAAAVLLNMIYPIILKTTLALGLNPDAPETLSKVTQTI